MRDGALTRTADRRVEGHRCRGRHFAAWMYVQITTSRGDGNDESETPTRMGPTRRGVGACRPASWDGFCADSAQHTEGGKVQLAELVPRLGTTALPGWRLEAFSRKDRRVSRRERGGETGQPVGQKGVSRRLKPGAIRICTLLVTTLGGRYQPEPRLAEDDFRVRTVVDSDGRAGLESRMVECFLAQLDKASSPGSDPPGAGRDT